MLFSHSTHHTMKTPCSIGAGNETEEISHVTQPWQSDRGGLRLRPSYASATTAHILYCDCTQHTTSREAKGLEFQHSRWEDLVFMVNSSPEMISLCKWSFVTCKGLTGESRRGPALSGHLKSDFVAQNSVHSPFLRHLPPTDRLWILDSTRVPVHRTTCHMVRGLLVALCCCVNFPVLLS